MTESTVTPIGHNNPPVTTGDAVHVNKLKSYIERVERLEEDEANIKADKREVYAEAKGDGFDVVVIRKVVAVRKKDQQELAERAEILKLYLDALGSDDVAIAWLVS